jgi:hypothetical protein
MAEVESHRRRDGNFGPIVAWKASGFRQQGDFAMFDPVMIVNVILAAMAVVAGLCSRSFLAALVAGIFLGLIHAGLVVLIGLQAGSLALTELPYLKDGVDMAMNTGHLAFTNARYVAYLVEAGFALLLIVIAGFLVRTLFVLMGLGSRRIVHA